MDFSAILGFGAIGLGFLLAVLSYQLLSKPNPKERPIYIFMGFCLTLVAVGAMLQYADSRTRSNLEAKTKDFDYLKAQFDEREKLLLTANKNVLDSQALQTSTQTSLLAKTKDYDYLKAQSDEKEKKLNAILADVTDTKTKHSETISALSTAQASLVDMRAQTARLTAGMRGISSALAPTQDPLQKSLVYMTSGTSCSGGRGGEPIPHGAEFGKMINDGLNGIAAALNIAHVYVADNPSAK